MWVEELPNGKYKFCERYFDEKTGKNKKVSTTLTSKSSQAKKQAQKILTKKINKNTSDNNLTTVTYGKIIKEFNKYYKMTVKQNTYIRTLSNQKLLIPYLHDDYLIDKVETNMIESALNDLHFNKGYSKSVIKQIISFFSVLFKYCKKKKYIEKNPINDLDFKFKPQEKVPLTSKYLSKTERELLISHLRKRHKRYADMTELFILNGFRFSELSQMKESDFHIDYVTISDSKTENGLRNVHLNDRSIEILNEVIHENKAIPSEKDLLFRTVHGTEIQNPNYNRIIKSVCKEVGINKNVTAHTFRHTHITILAELGVDLKTIMHRVGHAKPDVTLKVYTHVTQELNKQAVDKLNDFEL